MQTENFVLQTADILRYGVGVVNLVEIAGGNRLTRYANDARRNAHGGRVGGDFVEHYRAGGDTGVVPDRERAEHLCAGADQHIAADGGVALARVLAGAAEGHALIDGAAVSDFRRFSDDHAHTVINQHTAPDLGGGMDFNAGSSLGALADPPREEFEIVPETPVGASMGHERLVAGIEQPHFDGASGGGVALHNGFYQVLTVT